MYHTQYIIYVRPIVTAHAPRRQYLAAHDDTAKTSPFQFVQKSYSRQNLHYAIATGRLRLC